MDRPADSPTPEGPTEPEVLDRFGVDARTEAVEDVEGSGTPTPAALVPTTPAGVPPPLCISSSSSLHSSVFFFRVLYIRRCRCLRLAW